MRGAERPGAPQRDRRDAAADESGRDAPLPDLIRMDGAPRGPVHRVALVAAAAVCFVLGVVLWLTPVVTGVPLFVLAAITAGMASRRAAGWVNRFERRLPRRARLLLRRRRRDRGPEDSGPRRG